MTPEELLEHAISFAFYPTGSAEDDINRSTFRVNVERRGIGDAWAVVHMGDVWDGKRWVYEALPSNRTDAFKKRTRFPLAKAVEMASKLVDEVVINGGTYAQWQERIAAMKAAKSDDQ